jgi:hypothetical protein
LGSTAGPTVVTTNRGRRSARTAGPFLQHERCTWPGAYATAEITAQDGGQMEASWVVQPRYATWMGFSVVQVVRGRALLPQVGYGMGVSRRLAVIGSQ